MSAYGFFVVGSERKQDDKEEVCVIKVLQQTLSSAGGLNSPGGSITDPSLHCISSVPGIDD